MQHVLSVRKFSLEMESLVKSTRKLLLLGSDGLCRVFCIIAPSFCYLLCVIDSAFVGMKLRVLQVKVYMGDGWHLDFKRTNFDILYETYLHKLFFVNSGRSESNHGNRCRLKLYYEICLLST
ncbi:hypothetical protein SSX86_007703 [Deinandra increscens subsp. villosa]|uniref:Uncharacterized protein n=1 Tax=Deinandra increscens subsp. villosa TaxID=3103831 RepID=A0AAP0H581_9ASTR